MPWRGKGELRMRGNLDQRPSRECHSSREQAMHWLQSFSSSSSHFGAHVSELLPRQLEMERILGPFNSPLQMNKQTWWEEGKGERSHQPSSSCSRWIPSLQTVFLHANSCPQWRMVCMQQRFPWQRHLRLGITGMMSRPPNSPSHTSFYHLPAPGPHVHYATCLSFGFTII